MISFSYIQSTLSKRFAPMVRPALVIVWLLVGCRFTIGAQPMPANPDIRLSSGPVQLGWSHKDDGWSIAQILVDNHRLEKPSGAYTLLYQESETTGHINLSDYDMEGTDFTFYPSSAERLADGSLLFKQKLRVGDLESHWQTDPDNPGDFRVSVKVTAKTKGCFSIATPTLAAIDPLNDLSWGMIPGNWYGRELQTDLQLATHYSQGIPAVPFIAREKNTMTLCPLITSRENITLAVIPDPGTAQDPWEKDLSTRTNNKLAMSLMNRHDQLTPTAYSPVLGQKGSWLQPGQTTEFHFRYSIRAADWWTVFRHAVLDIYRLPDMLNIQQQHYSLSDRVQLMQTYLDDDHRSHWRTWLSNGLEIGANGTKNADVGAMLMMAETGRDKVILDHLPYVRNYKLVTQDMDTGFFHGAAMGEYAGPDGVAAERGNYIEPLFTTYYTLMDMGNMLLFHPDDSLLRTRVRLAADKLMSWQHPDGGTDVAYDRFSHQLSFPDLKDLRPTWYGLLIAYRILGDDRYLAAAQKGADWLIRNGVDKGYYLGVCGDSRNIWDFATAQCSEAFLELYNSTKDPRYKQAAITAAEAYATSIFTHPIATTQMKWVNGRPREDWEISQAGLSVEHIRGTAETGPILIPSFAGLYTRIYELTTDSLFLYMARAAARGRDAFIDTTSGQSLYYWNKLDRVEKEIGAFPHQAYWQVGWITDYLLSEAHLRSHGQISFPYGFMTPKVGPHVSYGFAAGTVYGKTANLVMPEGLVKNDNPQMEFLTTLSIKGDELYLIVLNQSPREQISVFTLDLNSLVPGQKTRKLSCRLPAWGIQVMTVKLRTANSLGRKSSVGSKHPEHSEEPKYTAGRPSHE